VAPGPDARVEAISPSPAADPGGELTLAGALGRALAGSPELAASSWEVRSREGRALQSGLRPNPELDVEIENFAGSGSLSGFDASEETLLMAQRLETAGKRPKRRRAAEMDTEVAAWEYEATRVRIHASVVRAFANVLAAQERVAVTEELLEVARNSVDAVARLISAGATPPVERTRAELEVGAVRVDLAVARRTLEAARAELAATWGSRTPGFEQVVGELTDVAPPPPAETVRGRLARNPVLLGWEREIERREAVVALEEARRMPDVTVAAGVRRLQQVDDAALVAGFSVPLPLFDRNQGARAAARSDLHKARHERHATEARLAADLEGAYQELSARLEEVTELQDSLLPRAAEAFEGVRSGYARGLFRNVDVLDAQRRLFELRLREIEALRAYHAAEAELGRLTGTPPGSGPSGVTGSRP
jgi:cobalt-zinc-cadmium efflux system outer membrane protein